MRKVIYSMGVSLDGFIAGPAGEIDWSAPDDELHRFHNEQTRELDAHFCGRRLYDEMMYWETADQNPSAGEPELEFARIWQGLPEDRVLDDPREGGAMPRWRGAASRRSRRCCCSRGRSRWRSCTRRGRGWRGDGRGAAPDTSDAPR
jgi:hypothetical protein